MKPSKFLNLFETKPIFPLDSKRKSFLYSCIIFPLFLFPYFIDAWWKFIFTTLFIFLFTYLMKGKQWLSFLGLNISMRDILICLVLFVLLFFGFKVLIFYQLSKINIQVHKFSSIWILAIIFQVLNEEPAIHKIWPLGLSYILHAAWNLTRFTGEYFYQNQPVSEGGLFNLLEGPPIVVISLIGFYLLVSFFTKKTKNKMKG
jgi:hypothetical protein